MTIRVEPRITVGQLRAQLAIYDDDLEVDFSLLDYNKLKQRGPNVVQVIFKQMINRDADGYVSVDNMEDPD